MIKKHYWKTKKVRSSLLQVMEPLNANILGLQASIFKLTMKSQAPKAMGEPFDKNLVTKMWVTFKNNVLLIEYLSEFLKLVEIVVVLVFGSMEDERNFSMLAFMKDKLHNRLGPTLNITIKMFA